MQNTPLPEPRTAPEGELFAALAVNTDVTEQKRLEADFGNVQLLADRFAQSTQFFEQRQALGDRSGLTTALEREVVVVLVIGNHNPHKQLAGQAWQAIADWHSTKMRKLATRKPLPHALNPWLEVVRAGILRSIIRQ